MRPDDFGPSLHDSNSFEKEANDMMIGAAKANAISLLSGAAVAIVVAWVAYTLTQSELGIWALGVAVIAGIGGFYITAAILAAILFARVVGGDAE